MKRDEKICYNKKNTDTRRVVSDTDWREQWQKYLENHHWRNCHRRNS